MVQHHKWSLTEIENMTPWERGLYVKMLVAHMKEEEDRAKERQLQQKRR